MFADAFWFVLCDVLPKSAVLLVLTWFVARLGMRRSSAAHRHALWATALGLCLLLPILAAGLPRLSVLPHWATPQVNPAPTAVLPAPVAVAPAPSPVAVPSATADSRPVQAPPAPTSGKAWCLLLWAGGTLVLLFPVLMGQVALYRIRRIARPADHLYRTLTPILVSSRCRMPMACGSLRRVVILPAEAEHWAHDRLKAVVEHELAHVRRLDCLWQTVGQLARAVYWFNPLTWLAYRQLLLESEKACDDAVLTRGSEPSQYAEHLLSIATTGRSDALLAAAAIAMARPSTLEGRLLSILDATRSRTRLTITSLLAMLLLSGMAGLPLAMLRAQAPAMQAAAEGVDQAMMQAWVENFFQHNYRDITARKTLEWGQPEKTADGNWSIRYKCEATIWNSSKVINEAAFTFTPKGEIVNVKKLASTPADASGKPVAAPPMQQRQINKTVSRFREPVDLSKPETAWAAWQRAVARMDAMAEVELSWNRITPEEAQAFFDQEKQRNPEGLKVYTQAMADAKLIEVWTDRDEVAAVISHLPFPEGNGRHPYSVRTFGKMDGQWKNLGEDRCPTLEAARGNVRQKQGGLYEHFQTMKKQH